MHTNKLSDCSVLRLARDGLNTIVSKNNSLTSTMLIRQQKLLWYTHMTSCDCMKTKNTLFRKTDTVYTTFTTIYSTYHALTALTQHTLTYTNWERSCPFILWKEASVINQEWILTNKVTNHLLMRNGLSPINTAKEFSPTLKTLKLLNPMMPPRCFQSWTGCTGKGAGLHIMKW